MPENVQGASPISAPLLLEWWKPVVGFEGLYEVCTFRDFMAVGSLTRWPCRPAANSFNLAGWGAPLGWGYRANYPESRSNGLTVYWGGMDTIGSSSRASARRRPTARVYPR